jgi:hypothetical protein
VTAVLGAPVTDTEDVALEAPGLGCNAATRDSVEDDAAAPTPASVWLFVVGALVIAASGWAGSRLAAPGVTPQGVPPPHGIEGFAEMYVATTLGGDDLEHHLAAFVVENPPSPAPGVTRNVVRVGATKVRSIGPDYWAVTVAAEIGEPGDGRTGLEFYEVAVAAGDGLIATGPPLPIPAPAPNAAYGIHRDLSTAADEATTAFMHDFLEAYLINWRSLPRFVTPDSGITAVTTLPVAAVDVIEVTVDAESTWATATAVATTAKGTELPITVSTRLVVLHGGPRVAELLPGPPPIAAPAE